MKMPTTIICWVVFLWIGMNTPLCAGERNARKASLCNLQRSLKVGETRSVRVDGIYSDGFEMGVLTSAGCPSQRTWVELDLRASSNKEILKSRLDSEGHAKVTVEGEFFGPARPDENLPELIRKSYHPGWGHLGAFRTKLVVHLILNVD
jgi:hypothetical protein